MKSLLNPAIVVVGIVLIFLRAFVFIKLWEWFLIPFGIEQIGLAHSMGIISIVSLLTFDPKLGKEETEDIILKFLQIGIMSLITLCFGYIYHSFM